MPKYYYKSARLNLLAARYYLQMGKMQNIQGLRALAVILVIAYHLDSDMFPHGYMGVDVFLVISGFLIGKKLLAIPLSENWPFRFLMRRIFRIWPSLALVTVFTLTLAWFLFDTTSYKSALYSTLLALGGGGKLCNG